MRVRGKNFLETTIPHTYTGITSQKWKPSADKVPRVAHRSLFHRPAIAEHMQERICRIFSPRFSAEPQTRKLPTLDEKLQRFLSSDPLAFAG